MSNTTPENEKNYVLFTHDLYQLITRLRKNTGQPSIDKTVVATRCGIAFTVEKKKWLNFKAEKLEVTDSDIDCIVNILQERFNIDASKDIHNICQIKTKGAALTGASQDNNGIASWFRRIFTGK